MPKNLSYSLENMNNMRGYIERPTNVTLEQIDVDTISIYWDNNPEADFYRVYAYNNNTNNYDKLLDDNGNDMWYWEPESCIEYYGLDENETVYIAVTSVKGNIESEFSDVAYIILSSQEFYMTLEEMGEYLFYNNSNLHIGNKSILIDDIDVSISDRYDHIYISVYISNGLNDFLDIFINNRVSLAQEIADIGSVVSGYYELDSTTSVIYCRKYDFYPDAFLSNNLYSNPVTYDNNFWYVFYPYVQVDLNYYLWNYDTYWAY